MVVNKITANQVYQALQEYYEENGYSPSVRELGKILGVPPSSVQRRIRHLKIIGWVAGKPRQPRSLKLKK